MNSVFRFTVKSLLNLLSNYTPVLCAATEPHRLDTKQAKASEITFTLRLSPANGL